MSCCTVELNWKRPPEWEKFEKMASTIHPSRQAAVGYELESAWHRFKNHDDYSETIDRILEGVGEASEPGEGEKILTREPGEGSGQTGIKISPQVREEMSAFADKCGVYSYEVLRAVVCYWIKDGTRGWMSRQIEKLESRLDLNLEKTATERRCDAIVTALRRIAGDGQEVTSFTLEQFNQAINEGPDVPKQADDNARETYLPLVLDRLNLTYHPGKHGLFVQKDTVSGPQDPRAKPKALTTEADTTLALAVDAAETVAESPRQFCKYTKHDAVTINGIAFNNAGAYMRRVAEYDGFVFDADETILKVKQGEIADADVLKHVEPDTDDQEWVDRAADLLADVDLDTAPDAAREKIVTNKIARAKYPDEVEQISETEDQVSDEAIDRVTDDERQQLLEHIGFNDETDEINAQFATLESGRRVATDGGEVIDNE